ncbi:hypothetical protein RMSM_03270 [Rhodopirellula maiorica SM1]|uniref:Uncharacterized protein n=1 Tax=Rhodopirellula maiorica SM1 TaxID=1265738 RepID=M5RWP3_9BACT|nr:hypothetical protein RMSM_03270 [Rhodopirellula maiorica SM1]
MLDLTADNGLIVQLAAIVFVLVPICYIAEVIVQPHVSQLISTLWERARNSPSDSAIETN